MADQGKWFKLHVGWDDDPHIDSLTLEDQARWCKFATYMKEHGTNGEITILPPARVLQHRFRVFHFGEVLEVLKRFPNIVLGEKQNCNNVTVTNTTVTFKNWHKYQADNSIERVRRFRAHVTAKKRGEEKRRDKEENMEKSMPFSKPTPEDVTTYATSIDFDLNGSSFCDFYETRGWRAGKTKMKDWKACVRTWKNNNYSPATKTEVPSWMK